MISLSSSPAPGICAGLPKASAARWFLALMGFSPVQMEALGSDCMIGSLAVAPHSVPAKSIPVGRNLARMLTTEHARVTSPQSCRSSSSSPTHCSVKIVSGDQKPLDHNGYSLDYAVSLDELPLSSWYFRREPSPFRRKDSTVKIRD